MRPRTVVWFSCGAASACAAKLAGPDATVVYCNTMESEHADNARFFDDVQRWIGIPITVIESQKYKNVDDVFEKTRYMAGIDGARCTTEMKKIPRFDFQLPDDLHIFGLCADEQKRIALFEANNPELRLSWTLRDAGVTKENCYQVLRDAGIALPAMYGLGFKNNNCIGCVKATSPKYWDKVRRYFPEVFATRCLQSRSLGVRLTRYHGERIFLDQLPNPVVYKKRFKKESVEDDIECGPVCVASAGGR